MNKPDESRPPTPTECIELLWKASRQAALPADSHVLCQEYRILLHKALEVVPVVEVPKESRRRKNPRKKK